MNMDDIYQYMTQFDRLDPVEAVIQAWTVGGSGTPALQNTLRDRVKGQMPLLARALDRLVEKEQMYAELKATGQYGRHILEKQ